MATSFPEGPTCRTNCRNKRQPAAPVPADTRARRAGALGIPFGCAYSPPACCRMAPTRLTYQPGCLLAPATQDGIMGCTATTPSSRDIHGHLPLLPRRSGRARINRWALPHHRRAVADMSLKKSCSTWQICAARGTNHTINGWKYSQWLP